MKGIVLTLVLCLTAMLKVCQSQTLSLNMYGRNRTKIINTEELVSSNNNAPLPRPTTPANNEERLNLPHNFGSVLVFLQRMNDRLTTIESLENQQIRKLESIDYRLTKLEIIGQDKSGVVEKSESQVLRKFEDLEWEINKFGTLIEVIRQDIDKIQQRQMELKATLNAGNSQSLVSSRGQTITSRTRVKQSIPDGDETFHDTGMGNDLSGKLQGFSSNIQHLRKATEAMQTVIYSLGQNLTDINNLTRTISANMKQQLTKQYFHLALKEQQQVTHPWTGGLQSCESTNENEKLPKDCSEIHESGFNKSGVHKIKPQGSKRSFFVFCDLENNGGGWTVIQRRVDGAVNFFREWTEYKYGFGNVAGEFWLGNENLHHITNQEVYELQIELEDFENVKVHANYSSFAVGSEFDGYMIKLLGSYEGNAGDSFTYHAGVKFSTKDVDNDPWDGGNCAEMHTGGWWYKGCETANLNGQYLAGDIPESMQYKGVYWYEWHGPEYSLQKTSMKVRPVSYKTKIAANPQ